MRTKFLVIAVMAMTFVGICDASAQKTRTVRALEVELGGGIATPTDKLHFDKNQLGWNALVELRYNFKTIPIDLGLHVDGAVLNRKSEPIENVQELKEAKFASLNCMAVADLNMFRAKGFSLFVGVGVGYGMLLNDFKKIEHLKDVDRLGCFCVMPRLGFEIAHHVRATIYYKQLKKEQNHFGVNLGIVLGGGKKK